MERRIIDSTGPVTVPQTEVQPFLDDGAPDSRVGVPEISLRNVSQVFMKSSGARTVAISDASLDIQPGEFVSLVGPSGCGKTTLLRIIAGLLEPTEGIVEYQDGSRRAQPDKLGVVFQQPALLPWLNIERNVVLPAHIWKMDVGKAHVRARELLEMMHLRDVGEKYPNELSGGMQQRAAIARSLLNDPGILLMDEPFGALDAMTREKLNVELSELHQKFHKTILFVTHDIREAVFLSDRVIVLSNSPAKIIADVTIDIPRVAGTIRRDHDLIPFMEQIKSFFAA